MGYSTEYQQFLNAIMSCDCDDITQMQKYNELLYDEAIQCRSELIQLTIPIDRIQFFEPILNDWVAEDRVTSQRKEKIIEYIEFAKSAKQLACNFGRNSVFFIEHRADFGFVLEENEDKLKDKELWMALRAIGKEVDEKERLHTLEKLTPQDCKRYTNLYNQHESCLLQIKTINKQLKQLYVSKDMLKTPLTVSELNKITENKNTELLIIEGQSDIENMDLVKVIQMRARKSIEKDNNLVVLSYTQYAALMATKQPIINVTKLSFLHHGSDDFGYVQSINEDINNFPNLKKIVLRGCGTAGIVANMQPEKLYEVKTVEIPYDNSPPIQGNNQLIIQQKEGGNGSVLTKLSWKQQNAAGDFVLQQREVEGIEQISSKKLTDIQLEFLAKIPGLPLLKYSNNYIHLKRGMFFNTKQALSSAELQQIKKTLARARTESISYTEPSLQTEVEECLLTTVLNNMTPEQTKRIEVKAYVGNYSVDQNRVIPGQDHGRDTDPKAICVKPKFA